MVLEYSRQLGVPEASPDAPGQGSHNTAIQALPLFYQQLKTTSDSGLTKH